MSDPTASIPTPKPTLLSRLINTVATDSTGGGRQADNAPWTPDTEPGPAEMPARDEVSD